MAIISLSVEDSTEQIIWGIPRYVTIAADMPSTIFYTLDGSEPTINSLIYLSPISIGAEFKITLKFFATNGVDYSPVITQIYTMSSQEDGFKNKGPALTDATPDGNPPNTLYPFGTQNILSDNKFYNMSSSAQYNAARLARADGYNASDGIQYGTDEDGYIDVSVGRTIDKTNLPIVEPFYQIKYPSKNSKGSLLPGYFPNNYKVIRQTAPKAESTQYKAFFDPRASVVFQNTADETETVPAQVNSHLSTNIDVFKKHQAYCTGIECPPPTNGFITRQYNPNTNETTYYYYDNWTQKWIISTTVLSEAHRSKLDSISVFTTGRAGRHVYKKIPFIRQSLI